MKNSTIITVGIIVAVVLLAANCLYVVRQIDRAVLLTFGEVTNFDIAPGLHFKIPGVHTVRLFDGRIQTLDSAEQSYLTAERQYLEVDSFTKWRVADVATYYTSTSGSADIANNLLTQRVNTGLRNQFGSRTVQEVVSGERDMLMDQLTASLNNIALTELGIEVVDIRVKKIELPDQVRDSVYDRMETERQEEAQELRSTGRELAEGIEANADRQRVVLEAEAYRESEEIRGEGDAQAAAIYAGAFNRNQEFYEFMRSLTAYRETFATNRDVLLIGPDSEFFKYLNSSEVE